jgi:hypothetical protein
MQGRPKSDSGTVEHKALNSFEDWRAENPRGNLEEERGEVGKNEDDGGRESNQPFDGNKSHRHHACHHDAAEFE